jgi:transposase
LDAAAADAFLTHGYTLSDISTALGDWHPSTIWRWIERTRNRGGG